MEPLNIAGNCRTDKRQKEEEKDTKRKERESTDLEERKCGSLQRQ